MTSGERAAQPELLPSRDSGPRTPDMILPPSPFPRHYLASFIGRYCQQVSQRECAKGAESLANVTFCRPVGETRNPISCRQEFAGGNGKIK